VERGETQNRALTLLLATRMIGAKDVTTTAIIGVASDKSSARMRVPKMVKPYFNAWRQSPTITNHSSTYRLQVSIWLYGF